MSGFEPHPLYYTARMDSIASKTSNHHSLASVMLCLAQAPIDHHPCSHHSEAFPKPDLQTTRCMRVSLAMCSFPYLGLAAKQSCGVNMRFTSRV